MFLLMEGREVVVIALKAQRDRQRNTLLARHQEAFQERKPGELPFAASRGDYWDRLCEIRSRAGETLFVPRAHLAPEKPISAAEFFYSGKCTQRRKSKDNVSLVKGRRVERMY
jgi:hypothetical protein